MATQKAKGKGQLVKRLTAQVGGNKQLAINILKKRGQMDSKGKLTKKGQARNNMTAGQRAIDRAAKKNGKPKSSFKYKASTNTAVRKKK